MSRGHAWSGTHEFECFSYLYCEPTTLSCQDRLLIGSERDANVGVNTCWDGSTQAGSICATQANGRGLCVEMLTAGEACGNPEVGACGATQFDGTSECVSGTCILV